MLPILDEIEKAIDASLYILALQSALAIPDICAALEYENNKATKKRYISWYEQWVESKYLYDSKSMFIGFMKGQNVDFSTLPGSFRGDHYITFTGDECYKMRCSMLHQGQSLHADANFKQIAFTTDNMSHNNHSFDGGLNSGSCVLNINLKIFCQDLVNSAREWILAKEQHKIVQKNIIKIAKKRSNYAITGYYFAEVVT
jgi:hypothetical protein